MFFLAAQLSILSQLDPQRLFRGVATSTSWSTPCIRELVFGKSLTLQEGAVDALMVVYISLCSTCKAPIDI
jgi:hypothetical protein